MDSVIDIETIELEKCIISKRSDDIIQHLFKDDIILDVEDIDDILNAVKTLSKGEKKLMLVITGERNDTTPEARKISFKNLKENQLALAEALVINSLPTRIAVGFFYKVYNPSHPVKTFKTEEKALEWLNSLKS